MSAPDAAETIAPRPASTRRRVWIAVGVIVAGVVVVNLAAQGLDRAVGGNQPGGVTGSSYATASDGVAAFASLLSHYGHDVSRQRGSIADHAPPGDATVFVLEPSVLTADDAATLVDFAYLGGRLVVGGESPFYLHNLRDQPPKWQGAGATTWTQVDPAVPHVRDIEAAGVGSWSAPGTGRVLVGPTDAALLTLDRVGRGEILFLADASPLENGYLGTGDNAAFALALSGDARRPVVFAEGVHGFGSSRGLSAIPDRWKVALILLAFAALAFVWSRARRFGPPDRIARDLPPARVEYVQALSISLERSRDPRGRARARATLGPRASCDPRRVGPECRRRSPYTRGTFVRMHRRGDRRAVRTGVRRFEHPGIGPSTRPRRRRRQGNTVKELRDRVVREVRKVVVGQDHVVEVLLAGTAVGGHVLLEGVPGVAKTLLANAFARALGIDFRRVQFTPDMLPSDLTGTMTLRAGELTFRPGPIFTNLVLADEINRTPPKTQAALLEAMQESQVSVDGVGHSLPQPFLVVATQNPIEYEGTYPLPEAQLDRFLVKLDVGYPAVADEEAMLRLTHHGVAPATLADVQTVATPAELLALRDLVDATNVAEPIVGYVVALVRRTRDLPSVALGASPRAAVHLLAAAKAAARLTGRDFVIPDDVVAVAPAVLRHRITLRPEAELEHYRADDAVSAAISSVPVPR